MKKVLRTAVAALALSAVALTATAANAGGPKVGKMWPKHDHQMGMQEHHGGGILKHLFMNGVFGAQFCHQSKNGLNSICVWI